MPYSVTWSELAGRQMLALDRQELERIASKVEAAADTPEHYFKRLAGFEESRLRVGDYRIIAHVNHGEKHILVESIGHRSSVYKKLK